MKRIVSKAELPPGLSPDGRFINQDLCAVRLSDGRFVILSGRECCMNRATTPETRLRLAQEIAYDEDRR